MVQLCDWHISWQTLALVHETCWLTSENFFSPWNCQKIEFSTFTLCAIFFSQSLQHFPKYFHGFFDDFLGKWNCLYTFYNLYTYAWMKSEMSGNLSFPREFSSFLCCICTEQMQRIPEEKKDSPTYLFSSLTYTYSRYINSYSPCNKMFSLYRPWNMVWFFSKLCCTSGEFCH